MFLCNMKHRLFFLLFFASISFSYAQVGGRSIYNFLGVTPEARAAALGGKNYAHSEAGIEFAAHNPTLLREDMHGYLNMNAVSHPSGIFFGSTRYAHHSEKYGTFGIGFLLAHYGEFDGYDPIGQPTGTFSASDMAFQVGYAYSLSENWRLGANMAVINSAYEMYSSFGVATDLAVLYTLPDKRLDITVLARNLGAELNAYSGERGQLPFDLAMSISNRFEYLPLRWFVTLDQLHRPDVGFINPANAIRDPSTGQMVDEELSALNRIARHLSFGGEFSPSKGFHFAAAYDIRRAAEMRTAAFRSSAGLSFGLGFSVKKVRFNYARNIMHISAASNLFSLTIRIDQKD